MPKVDPEIQKLYDEINGMIEKFREDQKAKADCTLQEKCGDMGDIPKIRLAPKKVLKGHINKVNSVHFAGDSRHCVTGSLDGKLIIWDTWTANKVQIIPLRSAWVMTVAFSPSGNFVACGGMDNQCTVYDVNNRDASGVAKLTRELLGYEGFLSSCRFLDDTHLITGSGDMKICHWDLEKGADIRYSSKVPLRNFIKIGSDLDVSPMCISSNDFRFIVHQLANISPNVLHFGSANQIQSRRKYLEKIGSDIDIVPIYMFHPIWA